MDEKGQNAWFRPKRYGYGAEPANWKGWLATAVYLTCMVAIVWTLIRAQMLAASGSEQSVLLWTALAVITVVFIVLCWVKTEGKWRWRWGQDNEQ